METFCRTHDKHLLTELKFRFKQTANPGHCPLSHSLSHTQHTHNTLTHADMTIWTVAAGTARSNGVLRPHSPPGGEKHARPLAMLSPSLLSVPVPHWTRSRAGDHLPTANRARPTHGGRAMAKLAGPDNPAVPAQFRRRGATPA